MWTKEFAAFKVQSSSVPWGVSDRHVHGGGMKQSGVPLGSQTRCKVAHKRKPLDWLWNVLKPSLPVRLIIWAATCSRLLRDARPPVAGSSLCSPTLSDLRQSDRLRDWDGPQLRPSAPCCFPVFIWNKVPKKGRLSPGFKFHCGLGESKTHKVFCNSSLDALICEWSDGSPRSDPNMAD